MQRSLRQRSRLSAMSLSASLLLASSGFSSVVRAAEREEAKRYQLRWVREGGAESCVSGAALERLLEQVLGARPAASGAPVLLEGIARVAAEPLHYSMRVSVRDAKTNEVLGERELTTAEPKCSALTPALLLVLAMSIDPGAGRDGLPLAVSEELRRGREEDVDVWPAAEGAPPGGAAGLALRREPPTGVAKANGNAAIREPRHDEPERDATHDTATHDTPTRNEPRVFGALVLSAGVFPALASGAQLGARVPLRRGWSLSFSVLGWFPQVVTLPASPYLEADGVQLAAGQLGVALCQPFFGSRLQLGVCGGLAAGLRWVSALALNARDNPTRPFYGPSLGVDGSFRVAPSWFISGGVTAQASVPRDRFTYVDHLGVPETWFQPSLFSGHAWLGVGAFL